MKQAPRLHVVTGKGGVGKTSVACALALAYAQRGNNVLLAEINGGDRVADAFGKPAIGYGMCEVAPKLWAMDLTPEASLREYVLLTIKVQAIYRSIFEGRLVSSFLRLLPALGELTMLGKVWYEWSGASTKGRPRFDAIVLDAPATGHARALLSAGEAVQRSVPPGPMRDNAQRIDAMLKAPTSQVDVVTTPEDMPVTEAEELLRFAAEHGFGRCRVIANQVPTLLGGGATQLAEHLSQGSGPLATTGRCLLQRERRAQRGSAALSRLEAVTYARVPNFSPQLAPLALLEHMAAALRDEAGPVVTEGAA